MAGGNIKKKVEVRLLSGRKFDLFSTFFNYLETEKIYICLGASKQISTKFAQAWFLLKQDCINQGKLQDTILEQIAFWIILDKIMATRGKIVPYHAPS